MVGPKCGSRPAGSKAVLFTWLIVRPGEEPKLQRALSWAAVHLGLRYTQRISFNYLMTMKTMIRVKLYGVLFVYRVLSM